MNRTSLLICFVCCFAHLHGQNKNDFVPVDSAAAIWQEVKPYFVPPVEYRGELGSYRSPLTFYKGQVVKTAKDWKERREEINYFGLD